LKVLILGSGGREHALAWACSKSNLEPDIYCAPGNGGTRSLGSNVYLNINHNSSILEFIEEESIDLTIIGPELPLVSGLADEIVKRGYNVFGPNAACAKIEGSKSWAKSLMTDIGVPTADYASFSKVRKALKYIKEKSYPLVVKADGLAAGKGVLVCENRDEAAQALEEMLSGNLFGEAGHRVVIEDLIVGREISIMALVDGDDYLLLPHSRDHKRAYNNNTGPNTGGMGAYAPVSDMSVERVNGIAKEIFPPVLKYFSERGMCYRGCLFAGIIVTENAYKVLEFNCRFGDPEFQAVLPLVKFDMLELMVSVASGSLRHWMRERDVTGENWIELSTGKHATTIVAVSDGYPGNYLKGNPITRLPDSTEELMIFHAGTTLIDNNLTATGGRVVAVTAVAETPQDSVDQAYKAAEQIEFIGRRFRTDIGCELK